MDPYGLFSLLKPIETFFGLGKFDGGEFAIAGNHYVNVVFYTVNILYPEIFHRSLGFAFEPGFYSIFLVLAIFFNVTITNKLLNKKGLVLIIALITTFSTTGFIAFFLVLIFYYYRIRRIVFFLFILFPLSVYFFFNTPFLYDKIIDAYEALGTADISRIGYNQRFTAGRFFGLKVGLFNLQQNPLIGFGDYSPGNYFVKNYNSEVGIINGIGNYLATLGGFGVLFLILAFRKTYSQLRILYGNITLTLSALLLTLSFSFSFPLQPLFGVFMVYSLVPSVHMNRN